MGHVDAQRREIAGFEPLEVMLADIAVRIQLSPTDHEKAAARYETITQWIDRADSPLHGRVELCYTQGGFAIGATIASHSTDDEFDIDGMAQLTLSVDSDPETPLALLDRAIRGEKGSRYHEMTERKTRCVTVNYVGMHLDVTPAVRLLQRPDRTSYIFHSKREEPAKRRRLMANPYGFAEWFKARTPADQAFATFFEERSLADARARQMLVEKADTDPVPDQLPAYRKSRAVIALQLIKRWRNLAYDRRHAHRRRPPSVLLAKYVADHANQTRSLLDELCHQLGQMIVIFEVAERKGVRVWEANPACPEDILTDRWPDAEDQRIFLAELKAFLAKIERLRAGAPMAEMTAILSDLFGERPARGAIDRYVEQVALDRKAGTSVHTPGIGRIPAVGAAAASAAGPAVVRATPAHTNFGD